MALPSNPMPSEKAPSSSAGATATDFSVPRTSVNHSRTKRMSRSSMVRSTNSCCLSMRLILEGRSRGRPRPRPPLAPAPGAASSRGAHGSGPPGAVSSRGALQAARLAGGEDGHGGGPAGGAADPAATTRAGAAEQHPGVVGLDTPPPDVLGGLGPRPAQVAVEDVAPRQADVALQ